MWLNYLLSTYYVPGTELGTQDAWVPSLYFLVGATEEKQYRVLLHSTIAKTVLE